MSDYDNFGRGPAGADGDPQDTGELLAAYLADDLDEVRARRLERRLEADADLREQLDGIHDVVVQLRRVDAVASPDGLQDRIRARVAAEASRAPAPAAGEPARSRPATSRRMSGGDASRQRASVRARRPAASPGAVPWWRRPIAAVAALALLGVVAVSSLGVTMLGSGGADSAAQDTTAMMAEGAEEAARADGGAEDSDAGAGEAAGEVEAFGFDEPEAEAAATAAASDVAPVDVSDLDSPADRRAYLEDMRARPETRRHIEGDDMDDGPRGERQRAVLVEHGLEESCAEVLVPAGRAAVQLILTELDGVPAAGVVAADDRGGLSLVLVDSGSCEVLAEERLPA